MINSIDKIKNVIRDDFKKLRLIEGNINKFESFVKKKEFLSALKIYKKLRPLVTEAYPDLNEELDDLIRKLNDQVRNFKLSFDNDLISSCEEHDLRPVVGDSRKGFKIKGIIEVKVDFEKEIASISTLGKSSKINSLKTNLVISEIKKTDKRLFQREWNAKAFLEDLHEIYLNLSKGKLNEAVLLKDVHTQLWLKVQSDSFWKSFDINKIKEYPIDEFSVDLSMLLGSRPHNLSFVLSEFAEGIIVYDKNGNFRTYKFLTFKKE